MGHPRRSLFLAAAALGLAASAPSQQCVTVEELPGFFLNGATSDLATLVGTEQVGFDYFAVVAEGQPRTLRRLAPADSFATQISGDGRVIAGVIGFTVVRWVDGGLPQPLHPNPSGFIGSGLVTDMTADGSVMVGEFDFVGGAFLEAFRWTETGGAQSLGAPLMSEAYAVSADGRVVVGTMDRNYFSGPAFLWDETSGLHTLPTHGGSFGQANDISADGTVVVGESRDANGSIRAFVWTETGGLVDPLAGRPESSSFEAVSADGTVAYGYLVDQNFARRPILWSEATGLVELDLAAPAPMSYFVGDFIDEAGALLIRRFGPQLGAFDRSVLIPTSPLGAEFCAEAPPNTAGCLARIRATGSTRVLDADLTLRVDGLPLNAFGIFFAGQATGSTPLALSAGPLCVAGPIGRFQRPNEILSSGVVGSFRLSIDVDRVPQPSGRVPILAGSTWVFQAWYRDQVPGGDPSNTSTAVAVRFR